MPRARIRIIEPPRYSVHRHMQSSVQHHRNVAVHLSAMEHLFVKSSPSVRVIMCVVHTLAPLSLVDFCSYLIYCCEGGTIPNHLIVTITSDKSHLNQLF